MKRGVLIALAVLAPFAGLIALGFWLLGGPVAVTVPPPAAPAPPPVVVAAPVPQPAPLAAPAVAVAPAVVAPVDAGLPDDDDDEPPREVLDALSRRPGLAGVERLVRQCFDDARDRVRTTQRVTVTYETTDGGRFENVVVKRSTWPDPQIAACVLDAFEESRFELPGKPLRHQAYTFTFSPADAGR